MVGMMIITSAGQKTSPVPVSDPVKMNRKPGAVPPPGEGSTVSASPERTKLIARVTTMSGTLETLITQPTAPFEQSGDEHDSQTDQQGRTTTVVRP